MFDGYLSVGTRSREYLRSFGIADPLIFDSPHAVDAARFSGGDDPIERARVRGDLGAADDDFLILFAGKFIAVKRPADVVAAAARLGPKVVVAMAGNGPLGDETCLSAERLGVRTTWCGFLNQAEMPAVLAAADCVAVPSRSETWGLLVNEALASGTPCVVSDGVGSAVDLIRAHESGAVYPVANIDELARALGDVRDALAAGRITRESCRSAAASHSFDRAASGIARAADRVLRRRQSARAMAGADLRVVATLGNMVSVFGLERMTFEVLRTLRQRGAAVHCVVNRWDSSRVVDLVDDIGASWSTGYYWYQLKRRPSLRETFQAGWDVLRTSLDLLIDARRFRPTHVLAPEFNAVLRSAPALWLLRRLGVKVILRLGNAPEPGRFYRMLWRHAIDRCVDRYVPNSEFIQRELFAHGIDRDKSLVIYNMVPHRAMSWQPRERVPGRIVFVGQIIPPKGVDLLLEAFAIVVRSGVDATLDIVGDMDGWEPPSFEGYRARVRARASQADIAGRVRLLGARDDVPELMTSASIYCQPSRLEQKEGFSVAALEAKRAGLPSVVTASGALPEMVTHLTDGWVCPEVSVAAIAEGLTYFLSNPVRARRAGEHARQRERDFGHERFATAWSDVFAQERHVVAAPAGAEMR
jgi:glycosyltransferase involved in cell wall biosynthesis